MKSILPAALMYSNKRTYYYTEISNIVTNRRVLRTRRFVL